MKDLRIGRLGHLVKKPLKRRKVKSYTRKIKRRRLVGGNPLVALGSAAAPAISAALSSAAPAIAAGASSLFSLISSAGSAAAATGTAAGTGAIIGTAATTAATTTVATGVTTAATTTAASSISAVLSGLAFGALQTAATAAAVLRPSQTTARRLVNIGRRYLNTPTSTPTPTPPVKESPTFTLKEIKDDPKKIKEYILNPDNSIKIPKGSTKDLKSDDISRITKANFRTLVYNGLYSGTPAEIVDGAINILEQPVNEQLKNYIDPTKAAKLVAEREAINALPEANRASYIVNRAKQILEETAAEQARQIKEATPSTLFTSGKFDGIISKIMDCYNDLFGRTPGKLVDELVPTESEISRALNIGVNSKGFVEYIKWLPGARNHFKDMSPADIGNFNNVVMPIMSQFRSGMLRSFAENPVEAANIFETFTLNVVPNIVRNPNSEQLLGEFLANLRQAPKGQVNIQATSALNTLLTGLGKQAMNIGTTTWRNYSSLPLRILTRAVAAGTTGIIGWFMITFQNTPNAGGFPMGPAGSPLTEPIKNKIHEWFGILLWENPPTGNWAQIIANAGGFPNIGEMEKWLASEGRKWMWAHLGMIITTILGSATALITYFRNPGDTRPITDETPLRPPEEAGAEENENHEGGRRVKRRRTKKNR